MFVYMSLVIYIIGYCNPLYWLELITVSETGLLCATMQPKIKKKKLTAVICID